MSTLEPSCGTKYFCYGNTHDKSVMAHILFIGLTTFFKHFF